jgi:hypothetical protein
MVSADRAGRTTRLLAHARFMGAWGHLLSHGVAEPAALAALAEDTTDGDLRDLARAGATAPAGKLGPVLDAHGGCLDAWLTAMLAGPRRAKVLLFAAGVLEREAKGITPPRAMVWSKLGVLVLAEAPLGDALSALAREARDHDQGPLAEGLYGAAKRARSGADLLESLRAASAQLGPLERAVLDGTRADNGGAVLVGALEALALLPPVAPEAPAAASAAQPPLGGLAQVAQAASAGAAPLRRGLERMLSGIEGALGIGPPPESAGPAQLAREAVQARAARAESGRSPAPAAPASRAAPTETPDTADAPNAPDGGAPAQSSKKKTIGMDSGPVPIAGFSAGKALVGEATQIDAGRSVDPSEAFVQALGKVKSKLTVIEMQPDEHGLVAELERELARLRATAPAAQRLVTQLDDLELRFIAWKERHGRGA